MVLAAYALLTLLNSPYAAHLCVCVCVCVCCTYAGTVTVTVAQDGGATYKVDATVTDMGWKAFLTPAPAGGSFTITATDGTNTANISDVTFGDVW